MMKKLLLTSSTKQEAKNAKRPHGTFIMLLLFALLLNSQNSFSQIYNFDSDVDGFDVTPSNLTVAWSSESNTGGFLKCTVNGATDPRVFNELDTPFSTAGLTHLNISVKNGSFHVRGTIIATIPGEGSFTYIIDMTRYSTVFEDISIPLGASWPADATVTKLRLDPNGNGRENGDIILYDYIRFQDTTQLSVSNTQVSEVKTTLYPNPVKKGQDVNIRLANINKQQYKHIAVYDLQGRSVINRTLDSNESPKLSTSQLPKGLYFVRLGGEDSSEAFKLIVD